MASPIAILRLSLFVLVTILSLIVLGLGSQLLHVMNPHFKSVWGAFVVATAALTVLSLPMLIITSLIRKAVFINYVIVELAWLGILSSLWLSSAITIMNTRNTFSSLPGGCQIGSGSFMLIWDKANCGQFWVTLSLSWVIWVKVTAYNILLCVLKNRQQMRGNCVWNKSVHEVDFFAPRRSGVVTTNVQLDATRIGTPDTDIKLEASQ